MRLKYKDHSIPVTNTNNPNIMKYKFQRLYYGIIINDCNCYSSILSKQRIDVAMTDDNLNIISLKKGMHENTIYKEETATKTILLPLNEFPDLEINTKFIIQE